MSEARCGGLVIYPCARKSSSKSEVIHDTIIFILDMLPLEGQQMRLGADGIASGVLAQSESGCLEVGYARECYNWYKKK